MPDAYLGRRSPSGEMKPVLAAPDQHERIAAALESIAGSLAIPRAQFEPLRERRTALTLKEIVSAAIRSLTKVKESAE